MRLIDEDVLAGESVKILTWLMERQAQGISTTLGNFALIESFFLSDDLDIHRVTIGYFLK